MEEPNNNSSPIVASLSIPIIPPTMDLESTSALSPEASLSVPTFEEQPALEKTISAPPVIRRQARNLTGISDRSNQKLSQLLTQLEANVISAFNKLVRNNPVIKQDFEALINEGKNLMISSPSPVLLTEYGLDLNNILDRILQESYNLDDVFQSLLVVKDMQLANQKKSEENVNKLELICSAKEPMRRGNKKKRTFLNVIYAEPTTPSDHLYAITRLVDDIKTNQEILDDLERSKEKVLENQVFPEEQTHSVDNMTDDMAKAFEAKIEKIEDSDLKETTMKLIKVLREVSQEKEEMPILKLIKVTAHWKEIHPIFLDAIVKLLDIAGTQKSKELSQKEPSQNIFTKDQANELLNSLTVLANSLSVVSKVPTATSESDSDFTKCKELIKSCNASLQILLSTESLPATYLESQKYIEEFNEMPTVVSKTTLSSILSEVYAASDRIPSVDNFWPTDSLNSWDNVLRELKKVSNEAFHKESYESEEDIRSIEDELKRALETIEEKDKIIESQAEAIKEERKKTENELESLIIQLREEVSQEQLVIEKMAAEMESQAQKIKELEALLKIQESGEGQQQG
ncbi:unnamed protein product [Blepharisma stoltei]|uniref:Uncharacterized protein n=1 Tax=Blepharisma stoltei TaxID=1481888 RepID=A0AAU9J429_9CILI|nr:unnamed protein product [Blepharisma stoltei]